MTSRKKTLYFFHLLYLLANPANIYLFKVAIETLEKGVKYVLR